MVGHRITKICYDDYFVKSSSFLGYILKMEFKIHFNFLESEILIFLSKLGNTPKDT